MRRLVVEFSGKELAEESRFKKVESFEILHILRLEPAEFAALVRVKFADNTARIEDLFPSSRDAVVEYDFLEQEKGGYATYFVKVKSRAGRQRPRKLSAVAAGGYLSAPFEFKNGRVRINSWAARGRSSLLSSL